MPRFLILLLWLLYGAEASAQFGAAFVSQRVPTSMTAGQSYPVSITMQNTGNTTWTNITGAGTPNSHSLGSQNPPDNVNWGLSEFPNRVPVVGSVAPGATTIFNFNVVAPPDPGTYDFQWRMVDDYVAWFGAQTQNVQITVSPSAGFFPNAQFVSQSVPTSMTSGQSYPVSITLQNTGNTTWTNTTGAGTPNSYSLGSQNPQDNVNWGLSGFQNRVRVVGSVAPAATTTFNFNVVAPPDPGTYDFQWQMVDDYVAWFGAQTPNVQVTVLTGDFNFVPGPISFDAGFPLFAPPVIGDVNGDGWVEPAGMINTGDGQLIVLTALSMGIQDLFSDTRPYDLRLADLNGDGCLDLVAQGYSAYSKSVNVDSRALLYFNDGQGGFTSDPSFANLNLNGRGEGLVVGDFNNDGALDLYLPYYTFGRFAGPPNHACVPDYQCPNAPQSYLLLNDGTGHFTEGDVPGAVDLSVASGGQPEGVQAADINDDGWIDLYVAGYLFVNRGLDNSGRVVFEDCNCGIRASVDGIAIDEGAKFLDWNNDGRLDLLLHDPNRGPQLYQNVGTRTAPRFQLMSTRSDGLGPMFAERVTGSSGTTYEPLSYCASYGMNIYAFDNNGLEDVIVAGSPTPWSPNCNYPNVVFRNTGAGFVSVSAGGISGWPAGGVFAFGDINRDGKIDILYMGPAPFYFVNATNTANGSFLVEVLGPDGEHNQHGRVVRVSLPNAECSAADQAGCTLTRVVDGGSGYHSQNQYPILVGTTYSGNHRVEVVFPDPPTGGIVTTIADVAPGQYAQVFAPSLQYPEGRVALYDLPPATNTCRAP